MTLLTNSTKLLCSVVVGYIILSSDHWVFDLKPGGSWKKVTLPPVDFYPPLPFRQGLHSLAWIDSSKYVVVSFDIGSEVFKMIRVPHKEGDMSLHKAIKVCLSIWMGIGTFFLFVLPLNS